MKIYMLCDMEGTSGIRIQEQTALFEPSPHFEEGRALMIADINAAIDGAFAGGATEVIVCDTHGGGPEVLVEQMDPRAQYELPLGPRALMPSLDESFDGVFLLGHHAMAGTQKAFLDHTVSSMAWFEYCVNNRPLGEIGIEAAYAGHFDVPVVMVSGDSATETETISTLGDEVRCAVVKWPLSRQRARCLHPARAREIIRTTAEDAVRNASACKAFKPTLPATVRLTFIKTNLADEACSRNAALRRIDGRTIEWTCNTLSELSCF